MMNSSQPLSRKQRRGGKKAADKKKSALKVVDDNKQDLAANGEDIKDAKQIRNHTGGKENEARHVYDNRIASSGLHSTAKISAQAVSARVDGSSNIIQAVKLGNAIVDAEMATTGTHLTAEEGIINAKRMQGDVSVDTVGTVPQEDFMEALEKQLEAVALEDEERGIHESFMREALNMAELALKTDETPVGCIFVHNGKIIGRGMNATNRTLNGTRHAEFMAISHILSPPPYCDDKPYPSTIFQETDLYVTVEPCIMCASLLRQLHVRKVYFGASNDKFGGTGGVLNIHCDEGIGGDPGYPVSGGWLREEAILALRKFYVQENEKAPEPRNKKERKLKTEIQPYQKPATPALSKTRNSRFSSKLVTPSSTQPSTQQPTQTSTQASTKPGTPAG